MIQLIVVCLKPVRLSGVLSLSRQIV
ncbi:hypothetical protein YPPY63_1595, partial [Yersinia pestis PY-63]